MRLASLLFIIVFITLKNDGVLGFDTDDLLRHEEIFERENMIGSDMTTVSKLISYGGLENKVM